MKLYELTPLEAGEKIRKKGIGVRELAEYALDRIDAVDGEVSAFLRTERETALTRADEVQKQIDEGTLTSPLAGVPYGLKDNICSKGLETTCASKILGGFRPPYDATVVKKMNLSLIHI